MRHILFYMLCLFSYVGIGQANIIGYEYWIDTDLGTKVKVPVSPAKTYTLNTQIPLANVATGLHVFNVRFLDDSARYSGTSSSFFYKAPLSSGSNSIAAMQYWFDEHYDAAISQNISGGTVAFNQMINTAGLPTGLHVINIRFKDLQGRWSSPLTHFFYKMPLSSSTNPLITGWQYWIDDDYDARVTHAVAGQEVLVLSQMIDMNTLSNGLHAISIRLKDNKGYWSGPLTQFFYKTPAVSALGNTINKLQYWFDNDYPAAITQLVTPEKAPSIQLMPATDALATGLHTFQVRTQDAAGFWSGTISHFFYKPAPQSDIENKITAYRYWVNNKDAQKISVELAEGVQPFDLALMVDLDSLSEGNHTIHFQFKDLKGVWSSVTTDALLVPTFTKYTFIGNGNWNVAANWENNQIPPIELPAKSEIIINTVPGGQCLLNVPQKILPGARFTIMPGKKITVAGDLKISNYD
jgi:hypothetical protein